MHPLPCIDLSASQAQTAEVPNRSDLPPLPPPLDIDLGVFISHAIATEHAIAQAIMQPVSAPPIPHSPARSFHGTSPFGNNDHAEVDPWVVAQNDPRNTTTDNMGAEPVQSPATLHCPFNPVLCTIATNTYIGNISIISHDRDADTGLRPSTAHLMTLIMMLMTKVTEILDTLTAKKTGTEITALMILKHGRRVTTAETDKYL
ncbi:hypothetical protein PM082_011892 [Marasmius tenuissimus]|nr:hypothetical protein PM082_011892 [Marasmius tenuissimus]